MPAYFSPTRKTPPKRKKERERRINVKWENKLKPARSKYQGGKQNKKKNRKSTFAESNKD